jgi:hypothetical protein
MPIEIAIGTPEAEKDSEFSAKRIPKFDKTVSAQKKARTFWKMVRRRRMTCGNRSNRSLFRQCATDNSVITRFKTGARA